MDRPTIGILAGMGPKTTGPFIDQVVSECQSMLGAKEDIDFPPMMIYSLPTPFFIDRPIDHEIIEKTLCTGIKRLEASGVAFIAMPCNTAHTYFNKLKQCVNVPLLNIINATLKAIPSSSKKIAILGTHQTLDSKLYQSGLEQLGLSHVIQPSWQSLIDELILRIKKADDSQLLVDLWKKLSKELEKHRIDTIILACTDLTIITSKFENSFLVLDSSLCLAKEVVNRWKKCQFLGP